MPNDVQAHLDLSLALEWGVWREKTRRSREFGEPPPPQPSFNTDARYCNFWREYDRITRLIYWLLLAPNVDNLDLWFVAVVARLVNHEQSLEALADCLLPFNPGRYVEVMTARPKGKAYGAAYNIWVSSEGLAKAESQVKHTLKPMWEARDQLRPRPGQTLSQYTGLLKKFKGINDFTAAQIAADLKFLHPLDAAVDWWQFAAPGPGSEKGLNIVYGRPPETRWHASEWAHAMEGYVAAMRRELPRVGITDPVDGQNLQNSLCEIGKAHRVAEGGKPKQWYRQPNKTPLPPPIPRSPNIPPPPAIPEAVPVVWLPRGEPPGVAPPTPMWREVEGKTGRYFLNEDGGTAIGRVGSSWTIRKKNCSGWVDTGRVFQNFEGAAQSLEPPAPAPAPKKRRKRVTWLVIIPDGAWHPDRWESTCGQYRIGQRKDDRRYQVIDLTDGTPQSEPHDDPKSAAREFEGLADGAKLRVSIACRGAVRIEHLDDGNFALVRFDGSEWVELDGRYSTLEEVEQARCEPRIRP
jgi:hypothetical protein